MMRKDKHTKDSYKPLSVVPSPNRLMLMSSMFRIRSSRSSAVPALLLIEFELVEAEMGMVGEGRDGTTEKEDGVRTKVGRGRVLGEDVLEMEGGLGMGLGEVDCGGRGTGSMGRD